MTIYKGETMHITIIALGSHGDVLPFATLGKALTKEGHKVRLAAFENFKTMAATHQLDFWPIEGDAQAILNAGSGLSLAESGHNVIKMWITVMKSFGVMAANYARDLSALAEQKTDMIINQLPGALYGYDLAQKLDIPMLIGSVIPLTPTQAFPMLAFPTTLARFPKYNLLSYHLAQQMIWQWYRPTINRWRKKTLGLPPWPLQGYFKELEKQKIPVINGFSPHIVPRPFDWGDHIHLTGYWFPEDKNWQPSVELCRFIENSTKLGSAPVFIGFGSMPIRNPEKTTQIILEALKQSKQHGILHTGWAGLGKTTLPDYVFEIDYAPYEWLFPQMSMIIHHGGSGTTGIGLKAGVPCLVTPFLFDQFYWGNRIFELGVGPKPIPFKKLTIQNLAEAITEATTNAHMQQQASTLSTKIKTENGVKQAVKIILT